MYFYNNVNFSLNLYFQAYYISLWAPELNLISTKCVMNKSVFIIFQSLSQALTGFSVLVARRKSVSETRIKATSDMVLLHVLRGTYQFTHRGHIDHNKPYTMPIRCKALFPFCTKHETWFVNLLTWMDYWFWQAFSYMRNWPLQKFSLEHNSYMYVRKIFTLVFFEHCHPSVQRLLALDLGWAITRFFSQEPG